MSHFHIATNMSHYMDRGNYSRESDRRDSRGSYQQPRFFQNSRDHHNSDGRPPRMPIGRSQSQSTQPLPVDYNQHIPRDYMPPPSREYIPQSREISSVPEFDREKLKQQRDLVLLSTVPYDLDLTNHDLCKCLKDGAKNEEEMLKSIEKLASVLEKAGNFIAECPDVSDAAKKANQYRSDLAATADYIDFLNGSYADSFESFFTFPPKE